MTHPGPFAPRNLGAHSVRRWVGPTGVNVKVKVKFNLEQTTKAQRTSRYIALLFL